MSGSTWNQPNEQHPELLSAISLNSFPGHDSSSRQAMIASQLGQFLVHDGTDQRVIQTGTEKEFGKATFSVKIPVDAEIIDIVNRYEPGIGIDSINHNPESLIIYEDVHTKQVGCLSVEQYCSKHQYFGFKYKAAPAFNHLRVGAFLKAGTILFDSPNIDDDGNYNFGVQANVCLMTHPATSEDGFLVSRQFLERQKFRIYETRVVEWGSKNYALYVHGTKENPKTYPDIGEYIPEHGILMALRSYDPDNLAPVEASRVDVTEVDHTFDEAVYVNGPRGKIIDIRVHHDLVNTNTADVHMNKQTQKYDKARRSFYQRIYNTYHKLQRKRGAALQLTPEFHRLMFETLGVVQESPNQKITKVFRQEPLDEYRVEFVIEYEITGDIGFKSTCLHAGKGVVCKIVDQSEMPVDELGNVADVVADPNATVSRMNLGRLYEHFFASSARDFHKRLADGLGVKKGEGIENIKNSLYGHSEQAVRTAWSDVYRFYKCVNEDMLTVFEGMNDFEEVVSELAWVLNKGLYLYIPSNAQKENWQIMKELQDDELFRPHLGPVTYVGTSGKRVKTFENIRVGSMYFILLEKIADDWSSVHSAKLQVHGVISQLTKHDKYSKPTRLQGVRGSGEAEVRILASYIGGYFVADSADRNNNPKTHRVITNAILSSKTPSNIENAVDRNEHPFTNSKPLKLIKHLLACTGIKFDYEPYKKES